EEIHNKETFANDIQPMRPFQRTGLSTLSKVAMFSNVGTELKLHLRLLEFLQVIVLDVIDNVGQEAFSRTSSSETDQAYHPAMLKAFLELCVKLGMMEEKGQSVILKEEYKGKRARTGADIITALEKKDTTTFQHLNEKENAFAFIYLAICYKKNHHVSEEILHRFHFSAKWQKVIRSGQFDYILMFAEYLLELL